MKTTLATTITLTALLIASPLAAQTQAQDTPQQTTSSPTERKNSANVSATQQELPKDQLKVSEKELHNAVTDANKASKIIGMEVRNTQNERVGKVKDLAIDTRSGRVAYAVISAGGGMFGGGKNVAVPLDALTAQPGQKHFVIDAPKDQLASAAGFADDAWPNLNDAKGSTIGLSAATVETEEERDAREEQTDRQQDRLDERRDERAEAQHPRDSRDQPKR